MKEFAVSVFLIVGLVVVAQGVVTESNNEKQKNVARNREVVSPGVTVPGMNSGYPCELGELGKREHYELKKSFWGDDGISQRFERSSASIADEARKLKFSL